MGAQKKVLLPLEVELLFCSRLVTSSYDNEVKFWCSINKTRTIDLYSTHSVVAGRGKIALKF